MRPTTRLTWALLATVATGLPALGQTSGGGGSSSGGSTSSGGGSSIGSSLGSSLGSSSGGGSSGSSSGSGTATTTLAATQQAPGITAPSTYATTGTSNNTAISSSNFFQPYYANVYYQGRAGATTNQTPGGFGVTLYGSNSGGGTGGGNIGYAGANSGGGLGSVTGSSSATSTFGGGGSGGRGSSGGAGGSSSGGINLNNPGGQIVPLPRNIAYQAVLAFQPPPPAAAQVQADIRGMLDRSTTLATPQSVQVIADGNTVVLRGAVRDQDEARTIEGMVRLTPGVHLVKNEMSYPRP